MSKSIKTSASQPASFGWFYGKNGSIKTVVTKPQTAGEIKGRN